MLKPLIGTTDRILPSSPSGHRQGEVDRQTDGDSQAQSDSQAGNTPS